jgi:hypothetical protein
VGLGFDIIGHHFDFGQGGCHINIIYLIYLFDLCYREKRDE